MTLFVASVLSALLISCLCSLMEATLLSLTPTQVADLTRKNPRLGAIWAGFKSDIERPIAVILILNTAAHTIGASVAGAQFDKLWGDDWIWVFGLVFTYLMLQFTEILPKTIGVRQNRRLAVLFARPLRAGILVLRPVIWLVHAINRPFERRTGGTAPRALEEITALAGLARLSREINFHQERIIRGASRLSQMTASQVMIPVEQVCFLSAAQSLPDALFAANFDLHTRYPVLAEADADGVLGYVNFKEVVLSMKAGAEEATLEDIIRPVRFVTGDTSASDLLRTFIDERMHMAIVRDEAGRTLGLVTMEDLVEELVGELEDEFDRLPRHVHELRGGTLLAGGGVTMREISRRMGGAVRAEEMTLSDWLAHRLGAAPQPGASCEHDGVRVVVRRIRRGRVFEAAVSARG